MHDDEDMTLDEFHAAFGRGEDVQISGSPRAVLHEDEWLPGATRIVTEWGGGTATTTPVDPTAAEVVGARPVDGVRNLTPA